MWLPVLLGLLGGARPAPAQDPAPAPSPLPRVLFLTHSAGFVHSVVKRPDGPGPTFAEAALLDAARGRYDVTATGDCGALSGLWNGDYDAVVFYTTGELPIPPEERVALLDWVRGGGAFVGVHCATDTFYEFPPYQALLGGVFDGHPWHEEVGVVVEDRAHPATRHLGDGFRITDEIYQFRDFARYPLHVLLRLDGASVDLSRGKRADGDYALAWCKAYGKGALFYTALGHREDVWSDPRFREHLLGGLEWALAAPLPSAPPPDAAVVLFDGADLSGWSAVRGGEPQWRVEDGALVAVPGAGDLVSRVDIGGDFLLHLELQVPPTEEGQGPANSGVYLQGRYEIQVLGDTGSAPDEHSCAALYGVAAPTADAGRAAGEWQSYDVLFRSPLKDSATGAKTQDARVTVWWNGVRVQDEVALAGPTAGPLGTDEPGTGPLLLQEHGAAVRYRNVWLVAR